MSEESTRDKLRAMPKERKGRESFSARWERLLVDVGVSPRIASEIAQRYSRATAAHLRGVIANLRRNCELLRRFNTGRVVPSAVPQLSPDEMATAELRQWRRRVYHEALRQVISMPAMDGRVPPTCTQCGMDGSWTGPDGRAVPGQRIWCRNCDVFVVVK